MVLHVLKDQLTILVSQTHFKCILECRLFSDWGFHVKRHHLLTLQSLLPPLLGSVQTSQCQAQENCNRNHSRFTEITAGVTNAPVLNAEKVVTESLNSEKTDFEKDGHTMEE